MRLYFVTANNNRKKAGVIVMAGDETSARYFAIKELGVGFWDDSHITGCYPQEGNAVRVMWENA